MSEEKQSTGRLTAEKKKFGKIKRILKLIGLALIAFVLILALIFQAPWKVTALPVIILLAFTILPESYRKWFWLSSAVVLIALTTWVFLPDDNEEWMPYRFDEEIADHELKFTIPEEENAATIYNQLLQDYDYTQWRLRFLSPEALKKTSSEPWLDIEHPKLTQWIQRHGETLIALPNACQMKKCRFPSNFEISPTHKLQTHRYFALKSWGLILLLSANNDIAKGRHDEAFEKYIHALHIADHLHQQKQIVDFLIGFGIEGLVLPPINRFVIENRLSEKQLQSVLEILGNVENKWRSDFYLCLEYEKLFVKNTFCSLVYQTNSKGSVRFSRDPAAAIWPHWRHQRALTETYWQKKSMKAYALLAWFLLPSTPQKTADMIDSLFEQYYPMTSLDFDWDKVDFSQIPPLKPNCRSVVNFLTNKSTRHYDGFHNIYLKRLAQRRGLRILIAMKQYQIENGCWPKNLDEIKSSVPAQAFVDPLNKSSFIYKLTDDSFLLYSKGKNNIDDNGKRVRQTLHKKGPDDLLIWPPKERKT